MKPYILFVITFFIINCECKQYHNYSLLRGVPTDDDQLQFFKNLGFVYEVNYWQPAAKVYRPVDFTISPADKEKFDNEAQKRGIHTETLMKNVQDAFDSQTVTSYVRRRMDTFNWNSFYRYGDIVTWLRDLSDNNPEMTLTKIGSTFEGRDILAVRIALKGADLNKKVIVEGGIHAREWASPAFVTYLLYNILKSKDSNNEALKKVAMSYEFFFVPVINPDGYEYTHTENRMWRKNRQPYGNNHGVDINRNFGLAFGTVGISHDKTDEIYCGPKAFSERESYAMAKFIESHSQNLTYYFGFHAYGQFMILPYGHSTKHWDNFNEVYDLCSETNRVIKKRHGTTYTVGTAYDTVGYVTSGGSGCWVKKAFNVPIITYFELRDQGKYGFALPPSQILPTCEETLDGIVHMLTYKIKDRAQEMGGIMKLDSDLVPILDDGVARVEMVYFVVLLNAVLAIILAY